MTGRVEGKVAFITGAARGQGRSHAIRLAEEGADIIAVDICESVPITGYQGATDADLAITVKGVEALGRRIVAHKVDVRNYDALKAALDDGVDQLGRVDAVSANAGIFVCGKPAHEFTEKEWQDVIDVNQTGVWHTCKAAIPHLIKQGSGGSIIITSSSAGHKGPPNIVSYSSSKHAVIGMMRTLALELAQYMIRVNTVHPTGVPTDMLLNDLTYKLFMPDVENATQDQLAKLLLGMNALPIPWVEPADVSNAVLFLASDESRYITGLELKIDAGWAIQVP